MSFTFKDLGVIGRSNTQTHFTYRTADTRRELESYTYWREAIRDLNIGDFIFVQHVGHGSAIYCVGPRGEIGCMSEWPHRQLGE